MFIPFVYRYPPGVLMRRPAELSSAIVGALL